MQYLQYKEIILTNGGVALVDLDDYEWLSQLTWRKSSSGAAVRNSSRHLGPQKPIWMHRVIMACPEGMVVDHINNNRLDNRKENLRICTQAENARNRTTPHINKCGYKGVYWHKGKRRWYAHITMNGKQKHIGAFHNIHDAARRYNEKAVELFGEYAKVNIINE
jgi:hypothetical protein